MGRMHGFSDDDFAMSSAEIGAALGLSPNHVDHIQSKALKKVRAVMQKRGLRFDDLFVGQRHEPAFPGHDQ